MALHPHRTNPNPWDPNADIDDSIVFDPLLNTDEDLPLPVVFEDEGQEEVGETDMHTAAEHILRAGLKAHLASRPELKVFSNLDVYYHPEYPWAYFSPDLMVVAPSKPLPKNVTSYRIGAQGPAPVLIIEVLSRRSFQQQDLTNKPTVYSYLGVAEYILVDGTGTFLEQRLLMRRLQDDGVWFDAQDTDGGVTSCLGFRVILEADGCPRVIDKATGKRYVRPDEAQAIIDESEATRNQLEEQVEKLEAKLARLRGKSRSK